MTQVLRRLPVIKTENTGNLTQNIPFTFGQVFAQGDYKPDEPLSACVGEQAPIPLQVDVKATHADGSVRHAIISGVLPSLASASTIPLALVKEAAPQPVRAMAVMLKASLADPKIIINISGNTYVAKMSEGVAKGLNAWLSGPIVNEWHLEAPFKDTNGVTHPHLTARFAGRSYGDGTHTRIEFVIENNKTFTPGAQNFTYDVTLHINNSEVFSQLALTHFHHARWRHVAWLLPKEAPSLHIQQDVPYIIASKAIPNYDVDVKPSEKTIADWFSKVSDKNSGPMKVGPVNSYMPATGGRPDIAPLPGWTVCYLLSMDKRTEKVMSVAAEGSAAWPIHYRDENTGYPVRADNDKNKNISTHMNMSGKGPLPVPRTVKGQDAVPYFPDTAHQPSFAYLPYLISGEYYYLEELHFWAAWNPLETAEGSHGYGAGLVRWQQIRGQAWSLRTLTHAAYITPDDHHMKDYFSKQLQNNIQFYHDTYVVGNPNNLGVYDGSGKWAFQKQNAAPWQDDYLTWAFGNMVEMGFESAKPIFEWKAKFPVGRMTAEGFCWLSASAYWLWLREKPTDPVWGSFAEVYKRHYDNKVEVDDSGRLLVHPHGIKYTDMPFNSAEQIAWLKSAGVNWKQGQMMGYASSEMGYPSCMQPALSLVASYDIEKAEEAWALFESRSVKPDYSKGPQFNIIPRPKLVVEPTQEEMKPTEPPVEEEPTVEQPPVVVTPVEPPKEEPPVKEEPPKEEPENPDTLPVLPNARVKLEAAIQRYSVAPEEQLQETRKLAIEFLDEVLDNERNK